MKNKKAIQINKWLNRWRKELKERQLKPIFVQWVSTQKCNFSCKHCGTDASKMAVTKDELTTSEMFKIIDGLAELGCKEFSVTGGEPLLRKDIFEVLRYARGKGIGVAIVSNGYFTEDYFLQLKKLDLYGVSIVL